MYGVFDKRKGNKMKKVLTNVVSVILIASMGLSVSGCAGKIKPVAKKDFKKALEESFDIDDDDYTDYKGSDYDNVFYVEHDYYVEYYQFDDEDDAMDMFDEFYDRYEDMVDDKDFKGRHRSVVNDKKAYGYILLKGESDDDDFFAEDAEETEEDIDIDYLGRRQRGDYVLNSLHCVKNRRRSRSGRTLRIWERGRCRRSGHAGLTNDVIRRGRPPGCASPGLSPRRRESCRAKGPACGSRGIRAYPPL